MAPITGFIFNIQRFSIHDGPGIRTTVFLKGCPLHCFWCHNPEGLKLKPEIQFYPARCILCGECVQVCEQGAHQMQGDLHIYDRSVCIRCGKCVEECCAEALQMSGKKVTADQVIEEVRRDQPFYTTSGGGMTLSGGEPLLQPEFTRAILEACRAEEIHTAIETCGSYRWDELARLLPLIDLVMMDLKTMDPDKHLTATGIPNQRILENARHLAETNKPIIFRVPIVPTVNSTLEEISAIAQFVRELGDMRSENGAGPGKGISLELLPFHRLAGDKYKSLGMEYRASDLQTPEREQMIDLVEAARHYFSEVTSR